MDYVWTPLSKAEFDGMSRGASAPNTSIARVTDAAPTISSNSGGGSCSSRREGNSDQRGGFVADHLWHSASGSCGSARLIGAAIVTAQSATVLRVDRIRRAVSAVELDHGHRDLLASHAPVAALVRRHRSMGGRPRHWLHDSSRAVSRKTRAHPEQHHGAPGASPGCARPALQPRSRESGAERTGSGIAAVSLALLRDCVTHCKLYDYHSHRWTDFAGHASGPALAPAALLEGAV